MILKNFAKKDMDGKELGLDVIILSADGKVGVFGVPKSLISRARDVELNTRVDI